MKKIILLAMLAVVSATQAAETIKIYSPYSAAHSGTPALFRTIDQANLDQNKYKFVVEFKPGGNQLIAVNSIQPDNTLAIIAPAFVDHVNNGVLNQNDYIPVHALGDACWAVVTNKSFNGAKQFNVGGVGFGNAAHLTALSLGDKHGFNVNYVVFKSNNDALVNMAGDNGIEMVIDKYENYQALKTKNDKLNMVAASCPSRLPQAPNIPTLKELGIDAPFIFNITIAHKNMDPVKRQELSTILNQTTKKIGAEEIFKLSAMRPPMFDNISTDVFYQQSLKIVSDLQKKHKSKLVQDNSNK